MADVNQRAVFLDRDGTLIVDANYAKEPDQVHLMPGVVVVLAKLKEQGFRLVVISNQSGIARGYVTMEQAEAVHQRMVDVLAEQGIELDATYYCPHGPDEGCLCRKPRPGMIREATARFSIDLTRSFMVGDRPSDIQVGRNAGCRTILLRGHPEAVGREREADAVAAEWPEVLEYILSRSEAPA